MPKHYLSMNGKKVPYSQDCKYLGLRIDSKLNWNGHIEEKINKCKRFLMKTVNETRSNFGPKPSLMKWGYTGLVRPVLTYGAMIWGHSALLKTNIEKLRKLNRLAANTITAVRRSNPTRALEIIYKLMPLHILIQQAGMNSFIKLQEHIDKIPTYLKTKQFNKNSHVSKWLNTANNMNIDFKNGDYQSHREKLLLLFFFFLGCRSHRHTVV